MTPDEIPPALSPPLTWGRSFRTSNHVNLSINSGGDLTVGSEIGQPGITVPVEDVRMILDYYDQRPRFTADDVRLVEFIASFEPQDHPDVPKLRSLASRIASLLPPSP